MTHTNTEAVSDDTVLEVAKAIDAEAFREDYPVLGALHYKTRQNIAKKKAVGVIAALSRRSASNTGRVEVKADWGHIVNEWADGMTNCIQWFRNIRDEFSSAQDALDNVEPQYERVLTMSRAALSSPAVEAEPVAPADELRDLLHEMRQKCKQNATSGSADERQAWSGMADLCRDARALVGEAGK